MRRVRSPKRRVRDDDFILGMLSECRPTVFLLAEAIHGVAAEILNLQIWWQAQYLVINDVSYVTRINHEIHFAWQAQYLVSLSCDVCCSARCK